MSESFGDQPRAGQEAARLLGAAQEWLRTSAPHLAPVTDDGEPCSCPLCRAVVSVREADPDSVARWVDSAVAAATSVLAQAGERLAATTGADDDADGDAGDVDDDGYAVADSDGDGDDDDSDSDSDGDDLAIMLDPEDEDDLAGQDGPRERGVRRIPLDDDH